MNTNYYEGYTMTLQDQLIAQYQEAMYEFEMIIDSIYDFDRELTKEELALEAKLHALGDLIYPEHQEKHWENLWKMKGKWLQDVIPF